MQYPSQEPLGLPTSVFDISLLDDPEGEMITYGKRNEFPEKDKPMEGNVGQVVRGDDPGVLVGGDAPVLAHASSIGIPNVASIEVRQHIEHAKAGKI